MSQPPPPTPRQAYDTARAGVMSQHRYTTEGIHAVCSCGVVGTVDSIGQHIESQAEDAGREAREKEVARRVAEHEAAELATAKKQAADHAARLKALEEREAAAQQ